jgi:UDP-N-acetylglucosamine 1-carboxyvinyltransferase
MVAAAVTRGNVTLEHVNAAHMTSVIHVLKRIGVQIAVRGDIINVSCLSKLRSIERIVTSPHPSFPTDLQAQMMVLLSLADGLSVMKETVFEGRFKHVDELTRMGADIRVDLNAAFIKGVPRLYGATVEATDLRAGAALVLAGLVANGTTVVEQIHHIDRGYDRIEDMLTRLGASVHRISPVASEPNSSYTSL